MKVTFSLRHLRGHLSRFGTFEGTSPRGYHLKVTSGQKMLCAAALTKIKSVQLTAAAQVTECGEVRSGIVECEKVNVSCADAVVTRWMVFDSLTNKV